MTSQLWGTNAEISQVLAKQLKEIRQDIHVAARHDSMPKPSADAAADRTSLCNRAGSCVHGSVGVLVRAMHGQFGNSITNVRFWREFVADRNLLETSGIVICAIALQPPAGVPGCLGPHELVNIWLHTGVMEFIPKQLEGHVLRQRDVKASQLDSVSVCCREVQLVGCWAFESMWTFVRYLDKNLVWSMRFFRFSSSPRPIGRLRSINCDVVELSPLAGGVSVVFWNGFDDIQRARRSDARRIAREAKRAMEAGESNT